jgi:hypothetical protein
VKQHEILTATTLFGVRICRKQFHMKRSLFVSNQKALGSFPGGVQWCTKDYLATLQAAGWQVDLLPYDTDQRLAARLRRRLCPRPFADRISPGLISEIGSVIQTSGAECVFLNNSEPLAEAAAIKKQIGDRVRLVFLSHGVESTDLLNDLRLGNESVPFRQRQPLWIGRLFLSELEHRRHLDGVVCMSEEDVLFERWLGSKNVCFLPRMVQPQPLDWRPVPHRVGTVGTLRHIPNLDGIRRFAAELERHPPVRLRVVGGPASAGKKLAEEFNSVEYMGSLDDAALKVEAATWCAFVNPIFCQARGASTKVATALGWGLPVLTTPQGARGYRWDDDVLPRMQTARELAQLAVTVASGNEQAAWKLRAHAISQLAPDIDESGKILRDFAGRTGSW